MKPAKQTLIFLVDDDALFLKLLALEFQSHTDYNIETFATAELCLANLSKNPDLIVLDYNLNSINSKAINGIETLDKIMEFNPTIPVVMLSSQDKIDVAINCMHHHAIDYIVKSETAFMRLQKTIGEVFRFHKIEKTLNWYMQRV